MKIIFLLIIVSEAIQPCTQCKFFKKNFWTDPTFGKCTLFSKPVEDDNFFVTGIQTPKKMDYYYCSTARTLDSMCGNDGTFYQKVQ